MSASDILKQEYTRFRLTVDEVTINQPWLVQNPNRVAIKDLQEIDCENLFQLGFTNWDDNIMLLPLWVLGLIANGEQIESIGGRPAIIGQDKIDTDTRYGMIAYGFKHAKLKDMENATA